MNANILIVEDEKDISDILSLQLTNKGHNVSVLADGAEALEQIQNQESNIDLYILDRMLPGTSGLEICKFLRMFKKTKSRPILMVTAMTRPEDIVEGLDAGADDYITKPFDANILMARVRALLRRAETLKVTEEGKENNLYTVNKLKVDTNQCKAWIEERELDLTLSEYKLLVSFLKQPGKVLTRNQLVEYIQDGPVHVTDRTIDTHIFGLRKKLKEYSKLVETIRGIGYRVAADS
ncbi:MAG: response regulator transcription factor [Halobacteriovoraceae bacterium]|nr:response regulator transcription factor [Halobacteriovoraceae bacterium]